jgi:hypothetical protein
MDLKELKLSNLIMSPWQLTSVVCENGPSLQVSPLLQVKAPGTQSLSSLDPHSEGSPTLNSPRPFSPAFEGMDLIQGIGHQWQSLIKLNCKRFKLAMPVCGQTSIP